MVAEGNLNDKQIDIEEKCPLSPQKRRGRP